VYILQEMVQQLRLTFTEPEGAPADPEKRIVG
jgi:hypothetical protein